MELRIDPALPTPVYEQIRVQLTRLVAGGRIASGTRLPTIRQLAADLRVAKGTVEKAYGLLEADGVIVSRGRSGTFALERPGADLAELNDAADTMAMVAHQLGIDNTTATEALLRAIARMG